MTDNLKRLNELIINSNNEELKQVFNEYTKALQGQISEEERLKDFELMKKRKELKEYILNIKNYEERLKLINENIYLFQGEEI